GVLPARRGAVPQGDLRRLRGSHLAGTGLGRRLRRQAIGLAGPPACRGRRSLRRRPLADPECHPPRLPSLPPAAGRLAGRLAIASPPPGRPALVHAELHAYTGRLGTHGRATGLQLAALLAVVRAADRGVRDPHPDRPGPHPGRHLARGSEAAHATARHRRVSPLPCRAGDRGLVPRRTGGTLRAVHVLERGRAPRGGGAAGAVAGSATAPASRGPTHDGLGAGPAPAADLLRGEAPPRRRRARRGPGP